ncbi:MAG: GntR family transcriptional regulator, partial [Idiomarina sp.]|nr:GntR family transcriptional regulator [Idiomarina sp.]
MSMVAVSLSEQISQHLAEQIILGELAPGERLHEIELAKQLNVSINSLREAMRLLEKQHLVILQPRRGAWVCNVSEEQAEHLYEHLFLLFGALAERAAQQWQPGSLDDLAAMLPDLKACMDRNDIAAAHHLGFKLVDLVTERFGGNHYLAADIRDLIPLLKRYSFIALQQGTGELDSAMRIFTRLLKHLLARDGTA